MPKQIDCIIVGYNEISFDSYEKLVSEKGTESGSYQYINTSFFKYQDKIYNTASIFDYFTRNKIESLAQSDNFSLTIGYLGTFLSKNNLNFDFVNSFQDEKEHLKSLLRNNKVLTIAITTTFYISPLPIYEIVNFIRECDINVKIIVGGPFIYNQVRVLEKDKLQFIFNSIGADFFVNSNQGEQALVNIINAIKKDLLYNEINNIYFLNRGEYKDTPIKEENNNLSENIVDWGLFEGRINKNVAVRTSLSCPFSCSFCSYPENAGKYRTIKVDEIEKELNGLEKLGCVKCVFFIDDTFNIPVKRFKSLLKMIIKNKYNFKWYSYLRCQFADREMVSLMKESGCQGVFLGIESGSDKILKNMNKKATVKEYRDGIALLKEFELLTFASFIIGFPGETKETVMETMDFIEKSEVDFYRAYIWYCDTTTPIYKQKANFNIQGSEFEWTHSFMNWKEAYKLRDEIYHNVEKSVAFPDFRYDFENILYLLEMGAKLDLIKKFLKSFNSAIKEKILYNKKEITPESLNQIRDSVLTLMDDVLKIKKSNLEQCVDSSKLDDDFQF